MHSELTGSVKGAIFGNLHLHDPEEVRHRRERIFSQDPNLADLRRLRSLYSEVGLRLLAVSVDKEILEKQEELAERYELAPTDFGYFDGYDGSDGEPLLQNCSGDASIPNWNYHHIPIEVLKVWKRVKEYGIFSSFSIFFEHEEKKSPCFLVGYFNGKVYPVIKWEV